MTWTVTALGTGGNSTTMATPVSSLAFTPGTSIAVGDGVAVFVQYTDFAADNILVTDNGSTPNVYLNGDSIQGVATGQCLASRYCASAAHTATTITVSFGTAVIQSFGVIKFTNSVAGTPTLDGHSGIETAAGTSATSSTANSTNGDLVLNAIVSSGAGSLGSSAVIAVTGSSPVIRNNQNTVAGYIDGSGVTTTGGANSVTSTYSSLTSAAHVCLQMLFAPPAAGVAFIPPRRLIRPAIIPIQLRRGKWQPPTTIRRSLRRTRSFDYVSSNPSFISASILGQRQSARPTRSLYS